MKQGDDLEDLVGDEGNNMTMNLKGIGCKGVDWINLARDREKWWVVVNTVIVLPVPQNAGNVLRLQNKVQ